MIIFRELIRASRAAAVKGHGINRIVRCPYCGESFKRTIITHLKKEHSNEWEKWRLDMLELYNEGLSSMEIVRDCHMLFSWSLVEREVAKLGEEKGVSLVPPLKRKFSSWSSPEELQKTTVWKFTKRGTWAVHDGRYRGNWPPQVPNNIVRRYSSERELVLDPFLGGGTTAIESWLLGRKCIGVDVSPHAIGISKKRIAEMVENAPKEQLDPDLRPTILEGDARDLSFLENGSVDLICTQPPYWDAIRYTWYVTNDLSHIKDLTDFCQELRKVIDELFRVLRTGGICAIQVGDRRKDGEFVPLGFETLQMLSSAGFSIMENLIKLQYADRSTAFYQDFQGFRIAHEYIFIAKKP